MENYKNKKTYQLKNYFKMDRKIFVVDFISKIYNLNITLGFFHLI